MASSFSYYAVVADYYLDTAAYIQNCINKNKPSMHCNGMCQLHKKLKQQQDNSDKQTTERKLGNDGPLTCNAFFVEVGAVHGFLIERNYPRSNAGKIQSMPRSFFHPPGNFLS